MSVADSSSRSTRILLIRHGETDWNAQGRIQGHLPVPLNERGLAQAAAVGRRLAQLRFQALYSSDLPRARQTAVAISERTGQEVHTDQRLREWNLGILSGLTRAQAQAEQPETWRIYTDYLIDRKIPGGESIRGRYERVTAAVADLASRHPGETIVVVSHGGALADCYRRTIDVPLVKRLPVDVFNASINAIRIEGEAWALEHWGEIAHLEAIGALANWEGAKRREQGGQATNS